MSGYVYLILSSSGHVKIGHSKDPEQRLAELQIGSAETLVLLAQIPSLNPQKLEARLHEEYSVRRINGEWFLLSAEEIGLVLLSARKATEWIRRVTPTRHFTEDEVTKIVKERLDRERKKYARHLSQTPSAGGPDIRGTA